MRWLVAKPPVPHKKAEGKNGRHSFVTADVRAWMEATGRSGERGRPLEAVRLASGGEPPAARAEPGAQEPAALKELSASDREVLDALVAGDPAKLIELAARVDPERLRRLAAMGRTRRELAEAERREIENRKARAEVVQIDDVRRFWAWQRQVVTSAFHGLPGKVSQALAQQPYDVVFGVLERELHELLEQLAAEFPS